MEEKRTHRQLEALLRAAREGDEEAFAQLYRATAPAQLAQAKLLLKSAVLAEEAVQESYLTLYRKMGGIRDPRSLVAFLNKSTFLSCQNIRRVETRRAGSGDELLPGLPDRDQAGQPEHRALFEEQEAALSRAVAALPERRRQAVVLHYFQGRKVGEIAALLHCSPGTVKRDLQLARAQLRREMGDFLPAFLPAGLALSAVGRQAGFRPPPPPCTVPLPAAALAGIAAVGGCAALALLPAPQIHGVQSVPAGGGAQVSVQAEGASRVWLEQGGRSLPCQPGEGGVFTLSPVAPGPCTAVATGGGGRTARVAFSVGDGDLSSPVLAESWGENGLVALRLQDPSGVDWATLSLTGKDGAPLSPRRVDEVAGVAWFDVPAGRYTLSVCDLLGNRGSGPFWVELPQ
ncbi:RNA polymerase sigma factor [Bittarella massiliensis (ex Durand et al. 2017)]|uniref:RNA polymerase sigma factor n=1 Tax=Bittarella massiliensis (ex Durand et al. 2017) TaxID=1720313 RepID=UPI001AA14798|nr:RNA polymerase sigma factor [Bittarella massiliensis (ex Durand et al. 2017)]MBO1678797.1 RNA polymerase sigma factor [Bittarella massiliensis (ex Durand et al. 2017)]